MSHNIHESLLHLVVDISTLLPLEGNPRKGNVDAIISSYSEFGQIRPIVIRPNSDGTATVIAGNHQLEAAKRLGWSVIAAVPYDVDNDRAIAFAIADNRTMELGYTEPELLNQMILEVNDVYPELLDGLGWDEFEIASLEREAIRDEYQVVGSGSSYIPPVLVSQPGTQFGELPPDPITQPYVAPTQQPTIDPNVISISKDREGNQQITLNPATQTNQHDAAVRGSTVVAPNSAPRAVVQYTIVFDDTDQQSQWYDFIKFLKSSEDIDGGTVGERLINFISMHMDND
jgi:hypothetical protein